LVLQTKPFVPFLLAAAPAEDKEEGTGKPRLQLQLAEDQKGPLEEFTRAHLGQTVAIVIGGDVVTTHKVKSAITGGRLQITRCTKHGCETLFTRLLKDKAQK
jgi:preprotein translocase subunit SecD